MPNLQDPQLAKLQSMRAKTIEMLRSSRLPEIEKKNLMTIMPYLNLSRLEPICDKLTEEKNILAGKMSLSLEQAQKVTQKIHSINRQMWKKAEENNVPDPHQLEKSLENKLSQISSS